MKALTTSAILLSLSISGAAAQEQSGGGGGDAPASATVLQTARSQMIPGRAFEGATLYRVGKEGRAGWTSTTIFETLGEDWTEIGQVADLVIAQDSSYAGIEAELDGRRVFLSVDDLALVRLNGTEVAYVTKLGPEALGALPDLGQDPWK